MNVRKWIIAGVVGAASIGSITPAIAAVGQAPRPVIVSDEPADEVTRPPETDRCITDHIHHPNDRCPHHRQHDRCITDHVRHPNDRCPHDRQRDRVTNRVVDQPRGDVGDHRTDHVSDYDSDTIQD